MKNNKGFSIIGVMVAAVIGLIVMGGISQAFINMNMELKGIENRGNLSVLMSQLRASMTTNQGCFNTLNPFRGDTWGGSHSFSFSELRSQTGRVLFDANDDAERVSYGFPAKQDGSDPTDKGWVFFHSENKYPETPLKDCADSSNWIGGVCEQTFIISLITQSKIKDHRYFQRPQKIAEVVITFTDPTDNNVWDCRALIPSIIKIQQLETQVSDLTTELDSTKQDLQDTIDQINIVTTQLNSAVTEINRLSVFHP